MYEATILGKKISLSDRQHKSLVKRWSPDNLEYSGYHSGWKLKDRCILCVDAGPGDDDCENCSFSVLHTAGDTQGCMHVIREIIGGYGYENLFVSWWSGSLYFQVAEETAKKYVSKVQAVLLKFKKV